MNIRKLLLIITAIGITGTLSAMNSMISNALQAGRPLKHEDIINTMLREEAFPSNAPAAEIDEIGTGYTLKETGGGSVGFQRKFTYKLEKPISFLGICNYKTEVLCFVGSADLLKESEIEELKKIKGKTFITYEINYSNIAKTGLLLAAGAALIRFAWMYAIPAEAKI